MYKLLTLLILFVNLSYGKGLLSGFCEQGGERVTIQGAQSTTLVQRSFSACTISVYLPGTLTLATLYSDDSSTPKANPFVASPAGYWYFYAADSNYDIKISNAGILNPFYRFGTISTGAGGAITSLTTDVVASGPGAAVATIQPNVVTYAKFQQVPTATILGRSTAGTGNIIALTTLPTGIQNNITRVGTLVAGSIPYSLITGGPTVPVSSVFGRTGAVVSTNGDYTASQVTNVPAGNISSVTVQAALNELDSEKQPIGNYITSLTGDVTASGPGAAAATLATVNSNVGSCGDATHVCQVTLNAKGLTTTATAVAITGGGGGSPAGSAVTDAQCWAAGPTFGVCANINLTGGINSGVGGSVAGHYGYGAGSATSAPAGYVGFQAPTAVTTPFYMNLPTAPTTGFLLNTGTTDPSVISIVTSTGSGNVVRATSPTLVTPILGTPTSGNASNLTNLPITLTTTGSSGASTYTQATNTLNIPQYSGGGGSVCHVFPFPPQTNATNYGPYVVAGGASATVGINGFARYFSWLETTGGSVTLALHVPAAWTSGTATAYITFNTAVNPTTFSAQTSFDYASGTTLNAANNFPTVTPGGATYFTQSRTLTMTGAVAGGPMYVKLTVTAGQMYIYDMAVEICTP